MKIQNFIFIIVLISNGLSLKAQEEMDNPPKRMQVHDREVSKLSPMQVLEDSLVYFADSMYTSSMPEDRVEGNYQFIRIFKQVIKMKGSYAYPFPKLSSKINILQSPDKSFRIYNWEVMRGDADARYYAVIQLSDESFIPLVDVSDQIIRGAEDSVFMGTRWYGCLYYNILQREINGQRVYFLLGWNGNSLNSERKILEAFGFNQQGQGVFGAPLFAIVERGKRKTVNRFVYEYQRGAKASMNYDKETDQIILDHCESQIGDPAKRYTYVPDGSYDGLKWSGNKWIMTEDVVQIEVRKDGNAPVEKPIK